MVNKCPGCGALIQTVDPKKPGFIREDVYLRNQEDFLCERCFNISHYNKNIKVNITEQDFINIANNISKQKLNNYTFPTRTKRNFDINSILSSNIFLALDKP